MRKLLLGVLLLAVAAFGVLYIGAVQAQASAASFCNSLNRSVDSYGFSVNENAGGNTVVGTLAACGDPHRTPLTYSVGGTDAAAFNEVFALDTNKGEIAVKSGASVDYESKRSYSLTVTVTDAEDSSEATIPMSITVLNVDDPGTIRLSTTEPRVGRQVSFNLSDPDGNPRIYRIYWARATNNENAPFVNFLPISWSSDLTPESYTPKEVDKYKLLRVRAYYVDDECIDVDSYTNKCRKSADAVFASVVANEEGLIPEQDTYNLREDTNSPATGRVQITAGRSYGVESPPRINNGLLVNTYSLQDADGLPAYLPKTYRWFRVDPETLAEEEVLDHISESHLYHSYVPTKADFGKSLKVQVSFYDIDGNLETLTSALTVPVLQGHRYAATGSPAITGTVQVGQTLSADTSGISDRNGIDYSALTYQWIANSGTEDTDIRDATGSTYTLVATDEGKTIKVRVSFTDESLYEESRTSAATVAVAAASSSRNAAIRDAPKSHDGQGGFTIELLFSEELAGDFSPKTSRDHAVTVKSASKKS